MIRIFYDVITGVPILEIQPQNGVLDTAERNVEQFYFLSERNRETFDYIEIESGQYSRDFAESQGNYRVNPETKELEFSYPDPNEPKAPPVYQRPLSELVNENTDYLLDVDFRLIMLEFGM